MLSFVSHFFLQLGQTPLFIAFDYGSSESAFTLIENGADTDTKDTVCGAFMIWSFY